MSVLNKEKIERCKKLLLKDYFDTSIIEAAVHAISYVEETHRDLEFLKFGKWVYIPREWFTDPTILPDFVFTQFGRGIAIGEENYIVQQILTHKEITPKRLETFDYESLVETLRELEPAESLVLFVPIKYFVPVHVDWSREQGRILMEKNDLLVDNTRIRVFWSSKYVDFDKIILARKTFGQWVSKPTVENRLKVEVIESEKEPHKLELKTQTVFNFTILNPNQIRVLYAPTPER